MLEGRKVLLRGVRRSDLRHFIEWLEDPEISVLIGRYLPISEVREEQWIREIAQKDVIAFTVIDKKTGEPIGNCTFHRVDFRNQRAEISILVGREYWGRSYAREAIQLLLEYGFSMLNLHSVIAKVFSFNHRSIRLFKSAGFEEAGILRDYSFVDGKFRDLVIFQKIRDISK